MLQFSPILDRHTVCEGYWYYWYSHIFITYFCLQTWLILVQHLQVWRDASVLSVKKCDFLSGINSLNLCPACLVTLSRGLNLHNNALKKVQCCYELQCPPLSLLRLESDLKGSLTSKHTSWHSIFPVVSAVAPVVIMWSLRMKHIS